MTRRITIATDHPYEVLVGSGAQAELPALVGDAARVAIVHPPTLAPRAQALRETLAAAGAEVLLVAVPDSEAAKTAAVLQDCWTALGAAGFTRSDVVVGLGGGATTDLAGFVAATWLRGVRFVNLPTTVLGMVDAAVGGKTGINTAHGKNLVGAFHEPAGVLCDLDVLVDLPVAELRSGMAEVLKCGFIADPAILTAFEADPAAAIDPASAVLADLIVRGIEVKADAVAGDLRETSGSSSSRIGREAVNYGHTLGHAIEKLENLGVRHGADSAPMRHGADSAPMRHGAGSAPMRHGEAISTGMVFVAELAHRSGLIDAALLERHRSVLAAAGLPISYDGAPWEDVLATMRLDKKSRGTQLRFVVLEGLGAPAVLAGPDESLLHECYRAVGGS
jgi:3-dehydroquinate synthase